MAPAVFELKEDPKPIRQRGELLRTRKINMANKAYPKIQLGVVFSTTGPYCAIGQEMQNGAMLAIAEINADPEYSFELEPIVSDPAGDLQNYYDTCVDLLGNRGIKHVVGCYTSSSRKEVLPVFEKYDGLLWYPSHYEVL